MAELSGGSTGMSTGGPSTGETSQEHNNPGGFVLSRSQTRAGWTKESGFVGKSVFLPGNEKDLDGGGYLCVVVAFRPSKKERDYDDDTWMVRILGISPTDPACFEVTSRNKLQLGIRMYRKVIDGIDVGIRRRELLKELEQPSPTYIVDQIDTRVELAALGYNLFHSDNSWYKRNEHGQHRICLEYCPCGHGLPIYAEQQERLQHTHVEDIQECVGSTYTYELWMALCKDRRLPLLPFKLHPELLWSPFGQYLGSWSARDTWLQTKEGQDSFLLLVYAYSLSDNEEWDNRHVEIAIDMLLSAFPEGISSVHRVYGNLESEEEFNDRCDRCDAEMAELNKQWRNEDNERIVKEAVESVREMNKDTRMASIRDALDDKTHKKLPRHVFSVYGGMNWDTGQFNTQIDRLKLESEDSPVPLDKMRSECVLFENEDVGGAGES